MFAIDDVELIFEQDAISEIARLAIERDTGARGLRSIMENILQPVMFDIPSRDDVTAVIIDQKTVRETAMKYFIGICSSFMHGAPEAFAGVYPPPRRSAHWSVRARHWLA